MANHYINNTDFLNALIEYRDKCRISDEEGNKHPPIPNYIGECFLKIAEHLSRKPNFVSYSFRDEMISDGIENCVNYFRNFDPAKSKNPFAYFTQIIYYAFLRRITNEKKQLYIKYKVTEQIGILDENEQLENEDGQMKQFEIYSNLSEFIHNFEQTKNLKKKKKLKGVEKFMITVDVPEVEVCPIGDDYDIEKELDNE
jgi:hypothetical protein